MRAPRTRTASGLRRLTALGLVAWLAGLACVLGCASTMGATASAHQHAASRTHAAQNESHPVEQESHSAEQSDSCAAMSGHDCCAGVEREEGKGRDGRSSAGTQSRGGRTAMHCPLGGRHASDPARKVRVDTTPNAAAPAAQSPAPESSYATPAYAARLLVRDRGSTYLRCCVFLI